MILTYRGYTIVDGVPVIPVPERGPVFVTIPSPIESIIMAKKARVLIRDGFTKSGVCGPDEGWDEVVFTYRPATPARFIEYMRAAKNTAEEQLRDIVKIIKEHLLSWNVAEWNSPDEESSFAPIREDTIALLPHPVLMFIFNAVTGYGVKESLKN